MSLLTAHAWSPGSRAEAHGLKPVTQGLRGRDRESCAPSFSSGRFPLSEGLESLPDERERQIFWILFPRLWPAWRNVLVIVKPETVVAWHRVGMDQFLLLRRIPELVSIPSDVLDSSPTQFPGNPSISRARRPERWTIGDRHQGFRRPRGPQLPHGKLSWIVLLDRDQPQGIAAEDLREHVGRKVQR